MNVLPRERRALILRCLVEGMSMRATARTAEVSKNTVAKLLVDAGRACAEYQDRTLRGLTCRRLQLDEIWAFVYAKAKNVPDCKRAPREAGDVWTWVAIDADTKLVPSWRIGDRTAATAADFVQDLRSRLTHRVQITSDGHAPYLEAVEQAFGSAVDYAQLVKNYDGVEDVPWIRKTVVEGSPDPRHVSTSLIERQNLTMRMSMRRYTRKTNGFSKRIENLGHSVAIHFMHYNFCRIHSSLRVTPAMEAGVDPSPWDVDDVVRLVERAYSRTAAAANSN